MSCLDVEQGQNLGGEQGYVYLIHFDTPFHHAQHYLGWTNEDVEARLDKHVRGAGSRLIRAVIKAGINIDVVRIWTGDRHFERRLKNRKNTKFLCPICRANEKAKNTCQTNGHAAHISLPQGTA